MTCHLCSFMYIILDSYIYIIYRHGMYFQPANTILLCGYSRQSQEITWRGCLSVKRDNQGRESMTSTIATEGRSNNEEHITWSSSCSSKNWGNAEIDDFPLISQGLLKQRTLFFIFFYGFFPSPKLDDPKVTRPDVGYPCLALWIGLLNRGDPIVAKKMSSTMVKHQFWEPIFRAHV